MSDNVVVIDSNALCHRVKHTMKDLSYHEKRTGVVYGFLNYVKKYSKLFETKRFVFTWDSQKSHRVNLYNGYKVRRRSNRTNGEKPQEEVELDNLAYAQFHKLRQYVVPTIGFKNNFIQTGKEADDVIASVVNTLSSHSNYNIILVTSDTDLYQLLDKCSMCNPYGKSNKGKPKLYTKQDFIQDYEIEPSQWALVKAIAGCSTDEVPGVKSIGESRAIKFINGKLKGKLLESITCKEGQAIIERNKPLVSLPMEGTKVFEITFEEVFYKEDFYKICDEFGLLSFTRGVKHDEWLTLFDMR